MKYVITESQHTLFLKEKFAHLKESIFRYWDINGGKNIKTTMKLFSLPTNTSIMIQEWLLEWMGGEEEVTNSLKKYVGRVMEGVGGTYDFKFYVEDLRIYTHSGIDIYVNAVVDGDGKIEVNLDNGDILYNIYDANKDEDIGWEVDSEIRDIIVETLEDMIGIEFPISVDQLIVTDPGKFDS